MPPAVETIHLTKIYSQHKSYRDLLLHPWQSKKIMALNDINLRVERGELVILLGPNGAGKTTLIKILCSLVLPTRGQVFISGNDILKEPKKARRSLGYVVSGERSFYWRLTGRQNLEFFAVLNNVPSLRHKISDLLDLVDLGDEADKMVKDYSEGMRQKLAIARGLLTDPDILFMDEPLKSLDPSLAGSLCSFIREKIVLQNGKTVIFATHNLTEAEILGDKIVMLKQGEIKAEGALDALRRQTAACHSSDGFSKKVSLNEIYAHLMES